MKRVLTIGLLIATATGVLWGQGKYLTNNGQISFFSHTAIEDIKAENLEVASVIDNLINNTLFAYTKEMARWFGMKSF